MNTLSIVSRRLKEARQRAGLSQERLGVLAGIDEFSASARMNQYERGKHSPSLRLIERIAQILGVPAAYFYTTDESLASLILDFVSLDFVGQQRVLGLVREIKETPSAAESVSGT